MIFNNALAQFRLIKSISSKTMNLFSLLIFLLRIFIFNSRISSILIKEEFYTYKICIYTAVKTIIKFRIFIYLIIIIIILVIFNTK